MKQLVAALLVTLLIVNQLSESLVEGQLTFSKSWSSGRKRNGLISGPIVGGNNGPRGVSLAQKVTSRLEALLKDEDGCFQKCHANFYAGILDLMPDTAVTSEYDK